MHARIRSRALAIAVSPLPIRYQLGEMLKVEGLTPLLMRPRHKPRWISDESAEPVVRLRRLLNISSCLIVLVLPGSFLMLPVLGWWFNWRRKRQSPEQWRAQS